MAVGKVQSKISTHGAAHLGKEMAISRMPALCHPEALYMDGINFSLIPQVRQIHIHCNNSDNKNQVKCKASFPLTVPFLGGAYAVDSLVCVLADLSLNVYKRRYIPVEMGLSFGGVFSQFIFLAMRSHRGHCSAICILFCFGSTQQCLLEMFPFSFTMD